MFHSMVVSLGPRATVVNGIPRNPRADGLGSNPRCLRRDVNRNSALGARANYSYSLITEYPHVNNFYDRYLGQPFLQNDAHPWGVGFGILNVACDVKRIHMLTRAISIDAASQCRPLYDWR